MGFDHELWSDLQTNIDYYFIHQMPWLNGLTLIGKNQFSGKAKSGFGSRILYQGTDKGMKEGSSKVGKGYCIRVQVKDTRSGFR